MSVILCVLNFIVAGFLGYTVHTQDLPTSGRIVGLSLAGLMAANSIMFAILS